MRIFITTMDEPIFINPFIREIIRRKHQDIVGVAVSQGSPLQTRRRRINWQYACTMAIILGLSYTIKKAMRFSSFLIRKKIHGIMPQVRSSSILSFAEQYDIPTYRVRSVQSKSFLNVLQEAKPDVVINQAQEILKEPFLSIPKYGCLNRHASLLPKYRGRLSPFWALLHGEQETGVSIHQVTEGIDEGDILVQHQVPIETYDDVNTLLDKLFRIAPDAMCEALDKIEGGEVTPILINANQGTFFSTPTLDDGRKYRAVIRQRSKIQ